MRRTVGRLSSRQVANAKPKRGREAVLLADGGNLYLQCTLGADGNVRRSWLFRYEATAAAGRWVWARSTRSGWARPGTRPAACASRSLTTSTHGGQAPAACGATAGGRQGNELRPLRRGLPRHPRDRLEERQAPPAMADDAHEVLQLHFRPAGEGSTPTSCCACSPRCGPPAPRRPRACAAESSGCWPGPRAAACATAKIPRAGADISTRCWPRPRRSAGQASLRPALSGDPGLHGRAARPR